VLLQVRLKYNIVIVLIEVMHRQGIQDKLSHFYGKTYLIGFPPGVDFKGQAGEDGKRRKRKY